MSVTSSEIRVGFRGEGAGVGELTWGQMGIWRRTQETGRTMNVVVTMPLPADTPLTVVEAALRLVVGRHPPLRTPLQFVDGPGGTRRPQQVVFDAGELPLEVVDLDDGDDADAAAEQLRSRYELTWFDYEHEFPIRMGVIRRGGAMAQLVTGYSHVMTDGAGLEALRRDMAHLDLLTGRERAPAHVLDPLRLARSQGTPAGQRQNAKCMRYWAAQLDRLAAWRPTEPAERPQPRFWELVVYSPAMELSLRAIAARTRTSSGHVLLAGYAVAVARVLGRDPNVVQLVVDNRFRPGFADAVGQVSEPGLCVIDTADATFDEVVGRALRAATNASLHAYYDTVARDRLIAEIEDRRGLALDIEWHLNDRRALSGPVVEERAPSSGELEEALREVLPRTKVYWDRKAPIFDGTLFVQVDSSPAPSVPGREALREGLPAVYLEIWTDTHHLAPAAIEAFARELESVLVEAALDAVPAPVPVPAPAAAPLAIRPSDAAEDVEA